MACAPPAESRLEQMITSAIEIRQRNKERIREAIQKHETCTKADIVKETDLSMATCSTALNEMLEAKEILKVDQVGAGIGRPSDLFSYNRDYLHVLSICVYTHADHGSLDLAVADALGGVIEQRQLTPGELSQQTIEELVAERIAADPLIRTVGIGIPGVVSDGVIEFCDIKGLEKADFVRSLSERFGVQVIVKNDMHIITYYLYHEQAERRGDFAAIYFPETSGYVGSGFIVNGHSLTGSTMLSGSVWHVAEAFGVSPDEQARLLNDRPAFLRFASQILTTICCTINPASVVLLSNSLGDADAEQILALCGKVLGPQHLPELRTDGHTFENYALGLIRLTLDSTLFPFIV